MQARIQHLEHFAMTVFGQPKLAPASGQGGIGCQSRHVQGSALFEEGQAAFIHEVPMLDTAHAALQAAIDGPRGISVSHDVEIGSLGFLNRGSDLLAGELGGVNAVGGRRNSATQHELEVGGAASDLLASCLAHFLHAITDDGPTQAAVTEIVSLPAAATEIAMPSRDRKS